MCIRDSVGPFIGKLLIQRLVKANPSPAYIARVTAAFNNNGQGVRGDMKAMIRAILLDEEAADCPMAEEALDGMLREPMVRYTQLMRAFNATSPSMIFRNDMNEFYAFTFQRPLASPSVFNFFQQDYQPIGPIEENGLVAPVFQIANSVSTVGYNDLLHEWIFDENYLEYQSLFSGEVKQSDFTEAYLDLSDELALQDTDNIGTLVERLNLLLMHGNMTDRTRALLTNALKRIPEERIEYRVKMAIYLVMVSPDYLIFR